LATESSLNESIEHRFLNYYPKAPPWTISPRRRKMNLNGMDKCIACFSSAKLSHTFKQFPHKDEDIIIPQGIGLSLSHSVGV